MSDEPTTPPQIPPTTPPQLPGTEMNKSQDPLSTSGPNVPAAQSAQGTPVPPDTISQLGAALDGPAGPGTPGTPTSPSATQTPNDESVILSWLMPIGLIGLSFYNFAIRFVTMGIYHFWGKTEVRRRHWSGIRLNGEPLVYTGKGMELFLGFLIVFFLILVPLFLIPLSVGLIYGQESMQANIATITIYIILGFLYGVAVYRAQRYRLSRTTWRGIRGQMTGSPWAYAWAAFWTGGLIPLTLGWILPWRVMYLQGRLTNEMRFGSQSFAFKGSSEPLYWRFAIMWFSTIAIYFVVLGITGVTAWAMIAGQIEEGQKLAPKSTIISVLVIYGGIIIALFLYALISAWYRARMMNHFASCTKFSGLQFASTIQARGLIYIAITNFFIRLIGSLIFLIPGAIVAYFAYYALSGMTAPPFNMEIDPDNWALFTQNLPLAITGIVLFFALVGFGLFHPVTSARRTGYLIDKVSINGTAPLHAIEQGAKQDIKMGEGLAEAFDLDAF